LGLNSIPFTRIPVSNSRQVDEFHLYSHAIDLYGDSGGYGCIFFSGIGSGLMYEPCGLDGDVCLLLPSSSSFSDHENMGNLDALGIFRY
jgi:hypothetical protein